jgi:hypothetical protein
MDMDVDVDVDVDVLVDVDVDVLVDVDVDILVMGGRERVGWAVRTPLPSWRESQRKAADRLAGRGTMGRPWAGPFYAGLVNRAVAIGMDEELQKESGRSHRIEHSFRMDNPPSVMIPRAGAYDGGARLRIIPRYRALYS